MLLYKPGTLQNRTWTLRHISRLARESLRHQGMQEVQKKIIVFVAPSHPNQVWRAVHKGGMHETVAPLASGDAEELC